MFIFVVVAFAAVVAAVAADDDVDHHKIIINVQNTEKNRYTVNTILSIQYTLN